MPIQLDKILGNIAQEKALHPNNCEADKKEQEDAWQKVAKNNNLSVHETRSIFKVLQKKYEQEKTKKVPTWKLFAIMDKIHVKDAAKEEEKDGGMEEDEYEMLEVQEDEEDNSINHPNDANITRNSESSDTDINKSHSSTESPEKDEKNSNKPISAGSAKLTASPRAVAKTPSPSAARDDKKVLNSMLGTPSTTAVVTRSSTATSPSSAAAAALSKKGITGITLKKTSAVTNPTPNRNASIVKITSARSGIEVGKTIQLPESFKRKLPQETTNSPQQKKMLISPLQKNITKGFSSTQQQQQQHTTTAQLMQVKHEREQQKQQQANSGINLITISNGPGGASSTAATVASSSTNGFSPRIEDIDFRNDIIFDAGGINGTSLLSQQKDLNAGSDIINLGNFENTLPPTFFKNLCNSSRHEALGLYVANVMNRLSSRSASKLELGILRAIIDVQSDDLE